MITIKEMPKELNKENINEYMETFIINFINLFHTIKYLYKINIPSQTINNINCNDNDNDKNKIYNKIFINHCKKYDKNIATFIRLIFLHKHAVNSWINMNSINILKNMYDREDIIKKYCELIITSMNEIEKYLKKENIEYDFKDFNEV